MMDNLQQAKNHFFPGAHNFSMKDAQFTEITNNINLNFAPPETALPPLTPLKHSSTFFTGRDKYLQRLKDYFSSQVPEGQRRSFLLHGMGGIGKTQICLKFIEQIPDLFSDIFWLDAYSEAIIEVGLMQIAQANNAPREVTKSPQSALKWISQRSRWLMVYDSADGHYSVVEKFLPPGNGGNILITSRNVGLKRLALDSMNVLDMGDDEAIQLLLKSAMLDSTSDHITNMAQNVISELCGIPLAVDQAGAYMQNCGCSIGAYLELFKKHKYQLMSRKEFKGASDYGTSTYGTWDVSIEQIEGMAAKGTGQKAQAAQCAIRLLRIFAFLNHENIPEELFKNAAENYVNRDLVQESQFNLPLSVTLLDHQTLLLNKGEWDRMQFLDGIKILLSFSLIKAIDHLYTMHPLVNEWSRHIIPKTELSDQYHRVRALLSCSIALDWQFDNYTFCKLLAPHIRANNLCGLNLQLESSYYDDEYPRFALVFHHIGSWSEEEKLLLVAVEQRKTNLGIHHLDTLATMHNLASTFRNQGRWDEAEKLEAEVMNVTKVKFGSDHPDTLATMHNLASIYWNQGRWDEAQKMQVEAMNAMKAKLGSDHPNTLSTMHNLALTYQNQGRWDEAEKLEVEVMNVTKAKLGSDHPNTLSTMHNLALTYQNQGRWDEAQKMQVEVMNATKAKLGSDHPNTLSTMHNLASTYWNQGRQGEAEKLQVEVMNATKEKLGSDHPDTLSTKHNLAVTYRNQGRWDEAEKLQMEVMNARKAKLGLDHPDTLSTTHNLGLTYQDWGRWDEAEKLQVEVMNATKAKLGSDHPNTLDTMHNLASTYWKQGRWDEAEKLQVEVMNARKVKLGPDHPDILRTMNNLAYQDQGRWDEAEKLQVKVMNATKAKLGSDHPDTLASMHNLALTYQNQKRWDQAEKLQVKVMNVTKAKLGTNHPFTLNTMASLALTYGSQGRLDEAESLLSQTVQTMQTVMGAQHPTTVHYTRQLDQLVRRQNTCHLM
ncbi:hypothetical protein F5887DRAFT_1289141 [Amanita rubescens]|nr:hypothetical protein F5887DRAFT_1289141 [Amanita rubescens]